jgi:hypothetical protein
MAESLRDLLAHAVKTGEVIRIVYHGGSQPGTVREVHPIVVTDVEMRAHDFASKSNKVFKLEKIAIPSLSENPPQYDPDFQGLPEPVGTIGELVKGKVDELLGLGWHVELSEDRVTLHTLFKNGKPHRGFEVGLWYEEYSIAYIIEMDGKQGEERRISPSPYHVSSTAPGAERHFRKISKALARFLEEAVRLAPTKWSG